MYQIIIIIIIILIILTIIYGYYSGSCQINKKYNCNQDFCLYKTFNLKLDNIYQKEINQILKYKHLQKRVKIVTKPETILNCSLPNRKGITITTQNINKYCPKLIHFYQKELCHFISKQINLKLYPTNLNLPTTCAILIYDNQGDWINWHYDYNYYKGRFFTVLIPITNNITCSNFQFKTGDNQIKNINLINGNSVCFEGNYLYHRASKLCKNQKRIILSCQYVTDNEMTDINKLRIKLKDFAFTGKLF